MNTTATLTCRPARIARTLAAAAAVALALVAVGIRAESASGTQVVLLGTAGGPSIKPARAQPANAVVVNGDVYIVDAGDGVARQIGLAGLTPARLRAVFITHLHSDHVADYGNLMLRAWMSGLTQPVETFGPAPLVAMTRSYLYYMAWDIRLRVEDEGRAPLAGLIRPNEIEAEGVVFDADGTRVTAFLVEHDAAKPAFGFRFDTPHRSIVFSGDTAYSKRLVEMSQGVDILVHEVLSEPGARAIAERIGPGNKKLLRHILVAHTSAEDVGRIAAKAQVGKLVLSHFVPTGLEGFDEDDKWLAAVRKHFDGEVVVGRDLMVIE